MKLLPPPRSCSICGKPLNYKGGRRLNKTGLCTKHDHFATQTQNIRTCILCGKPISATAEGYFCNAHRQLRYRKRGLFSKANGLLNMAEYGEGHESKLAGELAEKLFARIYDEMEERRRRNEGAIRI